MSFASDFFNLLLVRFHQAEIIIVKHLIQGCKAWARVKRLTSHYGRCKNGAPNHLVTPIDVDFFLKKANSRGAKIVIQTLFAMYHSGS